ncbi:MAG: hypothetical protein OEW43_05915 [Elusimicrobiota bacterium]|nr:hypothetical protein [Elusimicrobiota bacterium]MDH5662477.1 hypothetical protein [Elusimicrobiota bacterium]
MKKIAGAMSKELRVSDGHETVSARGGRWRRIKSDARAKIGIIFILRGKIWETKNVINLIKFG